MTSLSSMWTCVITTKYVCNLEWFESHIVSDKENFVKEPLAKHLGTIGNEIKPKPNIKQSFEEGGKNIIEHNHTTQAIYVF